EHIAVVALAMDNAAGEIEAILENVGPDLLQFHGAEDDGFCAGFGLPFLKAIPMAGTTLEEGRARTGAFPSAHGFLFDGHAAGEQGGSGQRFDWKRLPGDLGKPVFLAGGLTDANVGVAIRAARPWGVDVSSGI